MEAETERLVEKHLQDAYAAGNQHGFVGGLAVGAAYVAYLLVPWPVLNIIAALLVGALGFIACSEIKEHYRDDWITP